MAETRETSARDARDGDPAAGRRALGVVAGGGALPRLIAEARRAEASPYVVVAFEGQAPDWLDSHPHAIVAFEKAGRLLGALRAAGVTDVVFAGGLRRPKLRPLAFDLAALRLASTVLPLMRQGDDALLGGLARVMEREGFRMVAPHEVVAGLLTPAGDLSTRRATAAERADVARAADLVAAIGRLDIGQAAAVAGGLCLGLETLQGTDALIRFVGETPADLRARAPVLYKAPKPDQDWRVDLPAIGPDTIRAAASAGFAGVAAQAGGVLMLGLEATRAEADRAGVFLLGWTGEEA